MHGLDAIHDEVQDYLLQLHLVALHGRKMFVEQCLKVDIASLQLNTHNR